MHQTDKMEELSKHYMRIIASIKGYFCLEGKDYGTDLQIAKTKIRTQNNKKCYYKTGRQVDFQLKSVLEKNITETEAYFSYHLEVKNYNDLIQRMRDYTQEEDDFPLVLIVFIFPNNESEWVNITENELTIRKCAYWYYPESDMDISENKQTQVIHIPKENIIDIDFFNFIFQKF